MKFSEQIQGLIDGKHARNKDRDRYRRMLRKIQGMYRDDRDPFYFIYRSKDLNFMFTKVASCDNEIQFRNGLKVLTRPLSAIESVQFMGYQRQRKNSYGKMETYYTRDRAKKNDRAF